MTASVNLPENEALIAWRHDFHQHPETAFEEHRTSARIAALLSEWGFEVTSNIAGTGVVAALDGRLGEGKTIGLRADIDALDIREETALAYASKTPGKMHACGHDGHTTMLLGAAWALKQQPDFKGRVVFIFQPAEENAGGGRVMVEEGLFERFPMDAVYGLHNWPGLSVGVAAVHDTDVMAAFDIFNLTLTGKGCHAAMPHLGTDTVLASCQLISQLQGLVSRETPPDKSAVLSFTSINAGDTFNVIPEQVALRGTLRCFDMALKEHLEARFKQAIASLAEFHGLTVELDYQRCYPATINTPEHAQQCASVLENLLGSGNVIRNPPPSMASEDFSFLLAERPGAYIWMGNGEASASLHNPRYDFNDALLPLGTRYWVELVSALLV
ncbi:MULTISPECIES: M20 aminoacylase family protein [unclassified Halomonas]|uniref:M20 aminoacylase family protein n=1 Tax=unclassified Halomonas TaxID=2609666 RepID=UPI0006DA4456|nr:MULTISPECIES: M20 aminoacylase family protein [unclassified Halomonas]KPQ30770.1 MAG: hippurate hydrolase HipO [Halomonas sp. HL-93]SBR52674.1 hippurate hydrolase [Halomonas sp. HL-93]SNY97878.1 hippurate hydrolase [Halomonas sp. hl-4]